MKQLTQIPIEQYNEYMRRGEVMLPETVTTVDISEVAKGQWVERGGVIYMRLNHYNDCHLGKAVVDLSGDVTWISGRVSLRKDIVTVDYPKYDIESEIEAQVESYFSRGR